MHPSFPRRLKLVERLHVSHCLTGAQLPCGCVVGRYLTYTGHVLTVIDHDADDCPDRTHQVDFVINDACVDANAGTATV